jgi:steroid 5-alpha reductase family enzyme
MLFMVLAMAGTVAFSCFTLAELTGNCSQVDKIWSVVPMLCMVYRSGWWLGSTHDTHGRTRYPLGVRLT